MTFKISGYYEYHNKTNVAQTWKLNVSMFCGELFLSKQLVDLQQSSVSSLTYAGAVSTTADCSCGYNPFLRMKFKRSGSFLWR